MSFAEDVKNELCQYESSSDADVAMKIEASCLLRMGGSIILGMKGFLCVTCQPEDVDLLRQK